MPKCVTPKRYIHQVFILLLAASFLNACTTTREVLDLKTVALIELSAKADVNPDQDSRPSPVTVHVFALSDDRQFKREDFLSLYESAKDALGADLVDSFRLKALAPGENRKETLELNERVNFIGFLAEYQQYDHPNAKPLLILPLEPHKKNKYEIELGRIKIANADP